MGKIRLTGATSGYTELKAAEAAGNNTITLPTTNGGEVIVSDNSGNVNIDSGTFYVDASNNRVGIGSSSPSNDLDVLKTASGSTTTARIGATATSGANNATLILNNGGTGNATLRFDYEGSTNRASIGVLASDQKLTFGTAGSTAMTIDASQRLGIGTTSPESLVHINGDATALRITRGSAIGFVYNTGTASTDPFRVQSNGGPLDLYSGTGQPITFSAATTEKARIDSSGRLLVGTSTSNADYNSDLQIAGASTSFLVSRYSANAAGPYAYFYKSRSTTIGTGTIVQNGDELGSIYFGGSDGVTSRQAAAIQALVDGTPGSGDYPGRLVFSTTADGASSPTERCRINSAGNLLYGTTTTDPGGGTGTNVKGAMIAADGYMATSRDGGATLYVNRITSDGTIVSIRQDGTEEGTISVSGTTVSYNGAHLSRWSQLPSGAERVEILRGSVLSNIDEMCEWGEEDNEQLNRMKVSDVEGDKNVSGVFQAWDDDDDTYTNDFYCAMTGDFIIRIGAGVTVERGDLLMSAGDGTAKPQGDGYVQDKTVAKVTSTHITCTYDDGSYCVPCVLMAC